MCGIAGVIAFTENGREKFSLLDNAIKTLEKRGPDSKGVFIHQNVALGHTRLSIIDTTSAASQPFTDESGRYTIIYNGEFYNYKQCRADLEKKGVNFKTTSDTEVLLYLYIQEKEKCLEKINGFFAFAVYDNEEQSVFIARDRMGIKPVYYFSDENSFLFASEMKAIFTLEVPKKIDFSSVYTYLQLSYIPCPHTAIEGVKKLHPGHSIKIKEQKTKIEKYYSVPFTKNYSQITFDKAKAHLQELLIDSVQKRLVSDVPLGTFLSGGIDSSIITAIASQHVNKLSTFSVGYKDEPFFDETKYALAVSKKYNTDHHVFSLSNNDLFQNLFNTLDYIDEPFADSSALAVNILSSHTKKQVTVALSGDGADELFSGYNKHSAELRARNLGVKEQIVKYALPVIKKLPASRQSKLLNKARQAQKFAEGASLEMKERYWFWASFTKEQSVRRLIKQQVITDEIISEFLQRKSVILKGLKSGDFNEFLYTDVNLVLLNDMLHKVDSMSMAHGLEIRVPFLDHRIVEFAFSIPAEYKIDKNNRKIILKEAFHELLPPELHNRGKHGFEVPLLKWFRTELRPTIDKLLLDESFIQEQGIFNFSELKQLVYRVMNKNPQDYTSTLWALIVFQYWYKKYITD
jgi:asparagine synthase (glutamine-hydrolysing)